MIVVSIIVFIYTLSGCGIILPDISDIKVSDLNKSSLISVTKPTSEPTTEPTAKPTDNKTISIIAKIPTENIYLYGLYKGQGGYKGGVLLQKGDLMTEFPWHYSTPRDVMPVMSYQDYDNDGVDELAVILYVGSGTGVSVDELHIIKFEENNMIDYCLPDELYSVDLTKKLILTPENNQRKVELSIENQKITIVNDKDLGKITSIYPLGDIIYFTFINNEIIANFSVGIQFEIASYPRFMASLTAKVNLKDGKYQLSDYFLVAE